MSATFGDAARRALGDRLWLTPPLAAVALGATFYLAADDWARPPLFAAAQALAALAIVVGVRRYATERSTSWRLIAAGMGMAAAATAMSNGLAGEASLVDGLFLVGFLATIRGVTVLMRPALSGHERSSLLDSLIVTVGGGLLTWALLIDPLVGTVDVAELATVAAYPAIDLLWLALVLRLLFVPASRRASFWLIVVAIATTLVSDVAFSVAQTAGSFPPGSPFGLGWWISTAAIAMAALHPTMAEPVAARSDEDGRPSLGRVVLLLSATLVAPVVLVAQGWGDPGAIDVPVIAAGAVVLSLLVIARLWVTVAHLRSSLAAQRRLDAELSRLAAAVEQASEAIVITDTGGLIVYANPAFEEQSGYGRDEVIGRHPRELSALGQDPGVYDRMAASLLAGQAWSGEWERKQRDGSHHRGEVVVSPIRDRDGAISHFVSVARDVTALRAAEAEVAAGIRERAAIRNALRRLEVKANPEATAQAICDELVRLPGVDLAAMLAFVGPQAVVVFAERATRGPIVSGKRLSAARAADLRERAARGPWAEAWRPGLADDEFAARISAAGVRAVAFAPIGSGAQAVGVLLVATRSSEYATHFVEHLPGVVEVATTANALVGPALLERLDEVVIRSHIDALLVARNFRPVFQPVVELATGGAVGYEALTRFGDGTRPAEAFASARQVGLGSALEEATLEAALKASRTLPSPSWVGINISPSYLLSDSLRPILADRSHPLVLELTEHERIEDYRAVRKALMELGPDIRVAVDDAGAGVANFNHLVELRPDSVKIDAGLVRGVNADVTRQALIVGLRHFVHAIGHHIIAEGIETEAELAALRSLDVHYGQGYLLGRPARASAWRTRLPATTRPSRIVRSGSGPAILPRASR